MHEITLIVPGRFRARIKTHGRARQFRRGALGAPIRWGRAISYRYNKPKKSSITF